MELKIEYTEKELTPWGSMVLVKKLIEQTDINNELSRLPLPKQGSNRGFAPIQLINNFWVSIWSGASRCEHLEVTRQDPVIQKIFDWKRMVGYKEFQRYFIGSSSRDDVSKSGMGKAAQVDYCKTTDHTASKDNGKTITIICGRANL